MRNTGHTEGRLVVSWNYAEGTIKIGKLLNLLAGSSGRAVLVIGLDHLVAEIVDSNPAHGMDVCLFLHCAVLCR
jgi:hypothetical protein